MAPISFVTIKKEFALRLFTNFPALPAHRCNLETLLDVVQTWSRICGYQYRHFTKDEKDTYIIQHDMGKKWSIVIAETLRHLYEDLGKPPPEFDVSEHIVSFRTRSD